MRLQKRWKEKGQEKKNGRGAERAWEVKDERRKMYLEDQLNPR